MEKKIEIQKYTPSYSSQWNEFVCKSKNATFLFARDYMDYHSDRFQDCSFLFSKKGKTIALLPGNVKNDVYYSHQGLTYGGLLLNEKCQVQDITDIFTLLNSELKNIGIKKVVYKPIPYIYHKKPSQEDLYGLFLLKAVKVGCLISSCIDLSNTIPFIESRKSGIRKAIKEKLSIVSNSNFEEFWSVLEDNLSKQHDTKPVHSANEIKKLACKFPENIILFNIYKDQEIIAGCVLFINYKTVHVQYISANELGKQLGALDYLFDYLINKEYSDMKFFDFGHSCKNNGLFLNHNLVFQKEGFGARGVVYEVYEYNL